VAAPGVIPRRLHQFVTVADDAPSAERLVELGLVDADAPDAEDQTELVRYLLELGATIEQIRDSSHRGELALDLALRPLGPDTLADVVAESGISWPTATRLLTAVGLPADPDARLTLPEADAVRLLAAASAGELGEDATVQLARVAGNAMARVAETVVGAFRIRIEVPQRVAGTRHVDVTKETALFARTMLPAFVSTLDALIRRQIVAVAERVWSTDPERTAVTLRRAVGFADLVDYTALTSAMSARKLAHTLMAFDERVAQIVVHGGGQVVKTLGDEALFVTEDVAAACSIALELVAAFGRDELPRVRVGLATGEVVSVLGDIYGSEVNLAARLVDVAEPATVVASESVRAAVAHAFAFEALPPVALKGFPGPTPAYRLTGRTTAPAAVSA
jgi:adenylate cyclase